MSDLHELYKAAVPGTLGPKQLAWCRRHLRMFEKHEQAVLAVRELEAANRREMKASA